MFAGLSVALTLLVGAIGWVPTRRLAGEEGPAAMMTGCAIGLVSAMLAGALLVAVDARTPEARMRRAMFAMFARLGVVILLGAAAALSGEFARTPLLFWMAVSYMALLPLEVRLALGD